MLKTIKHSLALALALALCLSAAMPGQAAPERRLRIVATVFPQYDWLRNVLGDELKNAELTLLQDSGVDLHNFQPSAQDIMKVSSADLFVYIGGVSDQWVKGALAEAVNKKMVAVNLMEELGDAVKADTAIEGMQETPHDHDHGEEGHDEYAHEEEGHDEYAHEEEGHDEHAHEEEGHDEHDHEEEAHEHEHEGEEHLHEDEHIWLSLRNAAALTQVLADRLSGLDPDRADVYRKNAAAYIEKLKELDEEYRKTAESAPVRTLLFADRFPFRYLMDDYGLSYYAAFSGCSAETEASFETVTFLAGKMDELKLKSVMVLEGADKHLAGTVVGSTQAKNQGVLALDSMQSVDQEAIEAGASFLGIMQNNLMVLRDALK